MHQDKSAETPETQPASVRAELEQSNVNHQGAEKAEPTTSEEGEAQQYMGATEENVTPVQAPTAGNAVVTAPDEAEDEDEAAIDPSSELTPG